MAQTGRKSKYDAEIKPHLAEIEKAVKAIDECVKDTVEAAKANDYEVIIIADHGNADHALNEDVAVYKYNRNLAALDIRLFAHNNNIALFYAWFH